MQIADAFDMLVADDDTLDEIDSAADRAGYDMKVNGNEFQFNPKRSGAEYKYVPTIYAELAYESEYQSTFTFIARMECPSEIDGASLRYADSFENIADKYVEAAKFCTWLQSYTVALDEDEEE